MNREEVLDILRLNEAALRAKGVAHAALFGSLARGQARPDSDIDLFVEIDPKRRIGVWDYASIVLFIQNLFVHPVDVAERQALHEHVRPSAERDAIFAF